MQDQLGKAQTLSDLHYFSEPCLNFLLHLHCEPSWDGLELCLGNFQRSPARSLCNQIAYDRGLSQIQALALILRFGAVHEHYTHLKLGLIR